MTKRTILGRRSALTAIAAASLPFRLCAQETAPTPQVTNPVPPVPPPTVPVPPRPPAPVAPPAAIDKTKLYYLFFDQMIDVNSMRALRRQLASLVEAGVAQITVVIDSPGGAIDPMLVTYSFIRSLPAIVNTHAQGFVQSAATVLFLSGQDRSADRTARFLFHPSTTQILGTLNEQQINDRLTLVDTVQSVIAAIYQDRTKLTDVQVKQFARSEVIFSAEQAREAGIVDTVADLKIPGGNTARMLFQD